MTISTFGRRLARGCLGLLVAFSLTPTGFALAQPNPPELLTPVQQTLAADQFPRVAALRAQPTTQSLELVRINVDALRGDAVSLTMPGQKTVTLSRRSMETTGNNAFIWTGSLSAVPGTATLVMRDGNVTGTVQDGLDTYRIESVGDGLHALIKLDTSRFPPEEPPSFRAKEQERRGDVMPLGLPAERQDGPVGIDVMVAYTPAAKAAVADIIATIQLAVAEANQSYVNSGVNVKLKLVDTFQVNESEAGKSYDQILADFVANSDAKNHHASSGADLSAMIINQTDYCGLADAIRANAGTAYAVVHYSCATGYYSFAHELGHLMGARHDPANDPSTSPFPYGHGFQQTAKAPSWRTIMAYNCASSCSRLQYWSNPNVKYNNIAMGTAATHDNARVLNQTATTVAAFNSPPGSDIGSIWRSTGVACSGNSCPGWTRLDNNGQSVRIAAGGGNLYQLHKTGRIWRYTGTPCSGNSCPGWQMLDNNPATVAIAAAGNDLYQLHNTGRIWRYTGTPCSGNSCPGWQMLDNNPATVAIAAAGNDLYQLHNTGRIWRYTGTPCSGNSCPGWQMLDNNPATLAIAAGTGGLYQLHNTGRIWRYTGTPCSGNSCPGWQMLDNNPATLAIAAGSGGLYQLHNTGRIWRYTGTPCSGNSCPGWQALDNNPATADIAADGSKLYQLHNTGRIWRHTGTPCSGNSCPGWLALDNNGATGRIAAAGDQLYQVHIARIPRTRTRTCYDCR
ncbi:M12 family metallo-peptidase [Jiella sp. M17.18]|uniref:M12 family metallo-peptidase n=1 Tax=Jiella sp. M17.18 TaxID=3234247 RepID=UPI0034DF51E4